MCPTINMIHCESNSRTGIFPIVCISQCSFPYTIFLFHFQGNHHEEFHHFFALKNCLSCIPFIVLIFNFVKGILDVVFYIFLPFSFNIMSLTVIQAVACNYILFSLLYNRPLCVYTAIYPFF